MEEHVQSVPQVQILIMTVMTTAKISKCNRLKGKYCQLFCHHIVMTLTVNLTHGLEDQNEHV